MCGGYDADGIREVMEEMRDFGCGMRDWMGMGGGDGRWNVMRGKNADAEGGNGRVAE